VIKEPGDVFFLTRDELRSALADDGLSPGVDVAARRSAREREAHLVPPSVVGRLHPVTKRLFEGLPRMLGAVRSDTSVVSGTPRRRARPAGWSA
jgi:hypothetical protein